MAEVRREKGPGYAQLKKAMAGMQDKSGKVGWFESAKYEDGTPVAYVAAIQEFGDPSHNIPPRSFMRTTSKEQTTHWKEILTQGAKLVVKGELTIAALMEMIGLGAAGDIRKKISEITSPPLKVATVKARLRGKKQGNYVSLTAAKPLIDTKVMINTLGNKVE